MISIDRNLSYISCQEGLLRSFDDRDLETTRERIQRLVAEQPLENQPLNPFYDQEKLDRIRPMLLTHIGKPYHERFDEIYWNHFCINVVTGPLNEMELATSLICKHHFSQETDPKWLSQELYEINESFQGQIYQGIGKYRSFASLSEILRENATQDWSERETNHFHTALKAISWIRSEFTKNPNLFQEKLSERTYERLQRICLEGPQCLTRLFPSKTKQNLIDKRMDVCFEEEECLSFPPEEMLSPEERVIHIVHDYLTALERDQQPLNPFTDAMKLERLLPYLPGLSSDQYWDSISPVVEIGSYNAMEVLLLLLKPSLCVNSTNRSRDISQYLYEYGLKIGGCYQAPEGYRSLSSIDNALAVQNPEWQENEIQLLLNCMKAFKLGRENAEWLSSTINESSIRLRVRNLFLKNSVDVVSEISFLFPGKTRESIETKYIELLY